MPFGPGSSHPSGVSTAATRPFGFFPSSLKRCLAKRSTFSIYHLVIDYANLTPEKCEVGAVAVAIRAGGLRCAAVVLVVLDDAGLGHS